MFDAFSHQKFTFIDVFGHFCYFYSQTEKNLAKLRNFLAKLRNVPKLSGPKLRLRHFSKTSFDRNSGKKACRRTARYEKVPLVLGRNADGFLRNPVDDVEYEVNDFSAENFVASIYVRMANINQDTTLFPTSCFTPPDATSWCTSTDNRTSTRPPLKSRGHVVDPFSGAMEYRFTVENPNTSLFVLTHRNGKQRPT